MKVTLEAKHGTSLTLATGRAMLDSSELLLDSMVGPTAIKNLHADLTELMASKEYKAWANPAPAAKKTSKPVKKHAKPDPKASTAKRAAAGKAPNATSTSSASKKQSAATETRSLSRNEPSSEAKVSLQPTASRTTKPKVGGKGSPEPPQSHVNAAPVNERPRTGSMTTAEQEEAVLEAGGALTPRLYGEPSHAEQTEVVKTKVRRGRPLKTRPTVAGEVAEG